MNPYLKRFLHRGLLFGGFGPVITGIIYAVLNAAVPRVIINGTDMLVIILSTYLLAFIHAGASVFNQIEHWPIAKSLLCHFGCLYIAYLLCYVINRWITFDIIVVLIFTAVFVVVYFVVWLTVYIIIKITEKKLNAKVKPLNG